MGTDLDKPRLRVVAAAIFDAADRVLIAQRPEGKHMAGWWEFPGGKVSPGESDAQALERELREELGVESRAHQQVALMSHEYPDRIVDLVLWHASIESGEPRGLDGQQLQWVNCQSLGNVGLLPADLPLIPALQALSSRHDWCLTGKNFDGEFHGR
jgi:8-oxo-dGTP diphosphatase